MARKKRVIDESGFIFTLDGIACELGTSRSTLQRKLKRAQIKLSQWSKGKTSATYVSKGVIQYLKNTLLRSK